jgi:hypothetical protein
MLYLNEGLCGNQQALRNVGVDENTAKVIFQLLSAILQLGEIEVVSSAASSGEETTVTSGTSAMTDPSRSLPGQASYMLTAQATPVRLFFCTRVILSDPRTPKLWCADAAAMWFGSVEDPRADGGGAAVLVMMIAVMIAVMSV